ncbi:hypothetical protein OESDEN_22383 [Oesophagostomum dentatum]|uniref:Uncharacterized protein n=1 Tax=Oesophagostomum dentatum TaxID=61180 RepID=A0A0B1S3E2_OESDE|nr:hypothetical protein OESDEN_22383 [Oesophagostomum dentatum]
MVQLWRYLPMTIKAYTNKRTQNDGIERRSALLELLETDQTIRKSALKTARGYQHHTKLEDMKTGRKSRSSATRRMTKTATIRKVVHQAKVLSANITDGKITIRSSLRWVLCHLTSFIFSK